MSLSLHVFSQEQPNQERQPLPPTTPKAQEAQAVPPPSSEYAFPLEDVLPRQTQQTDYFYKEFIKMLGVLGLILGFILLSAWLLKKLMTSRIQQVNVLSPIKILESRPLTPKTTVYLLEIQGKEIAIAESQNGVTLLSEFSHVSQSSDENLSTFARILENKQGDER
jgi:flagellar protein FliO/FliZ